MPIQSKYTNKEVEVIIDELINVLSSHNAPVNISLMCLGNAITHIVKEHVPEPQRAELTKNFANVLTQSIKQ